MSEEFLIEELLSQLIADNVSDIFLNAAQIPHLRKGGRVIESDRNAVSAEDINSFRMRVVSDKLNNVYLENGSVDCAVILRGSQRCRLNFFETEKGPAVVVRPIKDGNTITLERLGLPPVLGEIVKNNRGGIILVTGATGSGKSTTMAALINEINCNQHKHILTIEDPIEFVYRNGKSLIAQREVSNHTSNFPEAIRNALRENPDVIVVGEMRDVETMQTALNAALTGHLVISTLHTSSAVLSLERLINMVSEDRREQLAVDLSLAMVAIVSQRLLPKKDNSGVCAALEILMATPLIRKQIADRKFNDLEQSLKEGGTQGMTSFVRSIFKLYQDGVISQETAFEFVDNPDELRLLLQGMESGVDAFRSHYGEKNDLNKQSIDMATLLRSAVKMGSSDLILSVNAYPCIRLNGSIQAMDLPVLQPIDTQRLLFSIITAHQRVVFEEKRELDFALSVTINLTNKPDGEITCRFRVNAFFQRGNIGIVARVINSYIPTPEQLSLPRVLLDLIKYKQGLILVTGPTGSGKTTTLASLINVINHTRNAHIVTIEDPIEYTHKNINSIVEQRELNADTLSFATALKSALRQDPDVILLGEMRDTETMAAALTAAETGHLVFATIHTNNAPQTVDRIVDSFPSSQQNQIKLQLAGCILGIVSQRLLKTVDGQSRVGAFEVMIGTAPVKALIRDGKTHQLQSAIETGFKDGMLTLDHALDYLYDKGIVSYEETQGFRTKEKQVKDF